jgi:hypothetical protein
MSPAGSSMAAIAGVLKHCITLHRLDIALANAITRFQQDTHPQQSVHRVAKRALCVNVCPCCRQRSRRAPHA